MKVTADLSGVDWKLLRVQKEWFVELLAKTDPIAKMLGEGLVHLLDDIQDQAANQTGPHVVYGDIDACNTCGCLPGDGITDNCNDPDGCGWSKKMLARAKEGKE